MSTTIKNEGCYPVNRPDRRTLYDGPVARVVRVEPFRLNPDGSGLRI